MAKIKVRWSETQRFEAVIDVDEVDAGDPDVIDDALAMLDRGSGVTYLGIEGREIEHTEVVESDQVLSAEAAKIRAPQHDDDWGPE